ncbi:MAG: DUF485 domain-containing protein [Thermoanaerobaculia bacterium]|nr:DUF485 domain-containing protein [Thermoanaerobaculia bacterium]
MATDIERLLSSDRFKKLVRVRWTVSITLLVLLFILYYGYILIVAEGKEFLVQKIGVHTNYGIVLGIGTIVGAWILTIIYVVWANTIYDKEVKGIKDEFLK